MACACELNKKNDLFLLGHKLVEAHPSKAVSWFAVGCYYYCIKQYDSAERYFQKATGMEKDFAPAWIGYGHAFASQDESDQAMAAYVVVCPFYSLCPSLSLSHILSKK